MGGGRRVLGGPGGPVGGGSICGSAGRAYIARGPGGRVETDKRVALRLGRLLAAADLRLVAGPPVEHKRLRDLVRCGEDLGGDPMRVRHRIWKFLLRRELYFPGRGRGVDGPLPRLAVGVALRGPRLGGLLRRLSARPRRSAGPPRRARPGAGRTRRGPSLVGDGRAAAVPARASPPAVSAPRSRTSPASPAHGARRLPRAG